MRKGQDKTPPAVVNGEVSPDSLGAYSRRAVTWLEGTYITVRPSFGDKEAIYAYRTDIAWDAASSSLLFREGERLDAAYTQYGEVAVPNQSGHIYLVTNRHGQHRLITVSRPTILGEMYGIITTLLVQAWRRNRSLASPAFEGAALYWHLVDVIWVFLYPLLYLPGRSG